MSNFEQRHTFEGEPDVAGRDIVTSHRTGPRGFDVDPVANADQFSRFVSDAIQELGDDGRLFLVERYAAALPMIENWMSGKFTPPRALRAQIIEVLSSKLEAQRQEISASSIPESEL